jgi:hypothetical protein
MNFRFETLAMAILLTVSCAFARSDSMETNNKVPVCLESDGVDREVGKAEILASSMFRRADVVLEWHGSARACRASGPRAIVVHLLENAPLDAGPQALARAYPFEGVRIDVFLDRIPSLRADPESVVLAHVLVHEITHILQDVTRHSETGVMKAQWSSDDYRQMHFRPLPFTAEDIEVIHRGLAARAAHPGSGQALLASR